MQSETTYSGILGELQRFKAALDANIAELQHLEATNGRFADRLNEANGLAQDQAAAAAGKQERSQRLKAAILDLRLQATVLRKAVRQFYGTRSEKLTEFGLQPFRGRQVSGRTGPDEPPTPTPPPATE
jgi:hypothetical protein